MLLIKKTLRTNSRMYWKLKHPLGNFSNGYTNAKIVYTSIHSFQQKITGPKVQRLVVITSETA